MSETEKGGEREGGEEREEARNEERIMHGEGEADHLHRNKGRGAATPIQQASEPLPVTTRVDGSEGLEGPGEQEKTTQGASHSGGAAGTPPDVDPRLPSQYTTTGRTRPNTACHGFAGSNGTAPTASSSVTSSPGARARRPEVSNPTSSSCFPYGTRPPGTIRPTPHPSTGRDPPRRWPPGVSLSSLPTNEPGIPLGQEQSGPFHNIGGRQAHGRPHNPNQLSHPLHIN